MSLSRADRRAKERRDKKNKFKAQVASVSVLTTMGISLAPAGAFAAVIGTPAAPTVIDSCGVVNDRAILDASADVLWYQVNENPDGTETLVAVDAEVAADGLAAEFAAVPATAGDTFADGSVEIRFPVTYTDVACVVVTAEEPVFLDFSGTDNDRVQIPDTVGVQYFLNGNAVVPGTYDVAGEVVITAEAEEGYALDDTVPALWENIFGAEATATVVVAAEPVFVDESGTADDVVVIPASEGVQYTLNGEVVTAGEYPVVGDAVVTVEALAGFELDPDEATMWNFAFDAAVTDVVVTPAAPVFTDESGTADDVVVIPASEGVEYTLNGEAVVAGEYAGEGDVTVVANAAAGYDLDPDAPSTWNFAFDAAVDLTVVSPAEPLFTDEPGTDNDVVVIPATEGVEYTLNGEVVVAGEYPATGDVTVVATATDGFELAPDATSTWNFAFDAAAEAVIVSPAVPVFNDLPGTANDEYVIPETEGVEYTVNGEVVVAGTYPASGTVAIEAVALEGFELDPAATSLWNFTFETTMADTVVSPGAPEFLDESGTANDQVIIPATTGIVWFLDGVVTEPGTYDVSGTVEVRAEAAEGYALTEGATSVWTNTFSAEVDAPVEGVPVDVVEPAFSAELNVVTIPAVEGLQFFLNGEAVEAGSYAITADAVVTATVEDGYTVPAGTVLAWDYAFTAAPVDTPPVDTPVDTPPVDVPVDTPVDTPVIDNPVIDVPVIAPILPADTSDIGSCPAVGGPFYEGDAGYSAERDGDSDGIACEDGEGTAVVSDTDGLAETGANAGLIVLLGAGGLLTAAGASTIISGRRRKSVEG